MKTTPEQLARILHAALQDEEWEEVTLRDLAEVFIYEGSNHPNTASLRRALDKVLQAVHQAEQKR